MAIQIRTISDEDWQILKRIYEANSNTLQSSPTRPTANSQYLDGDDSMSPEVYIALPPEGGIPALQRTSSTGTASGTSDLPQEWDTPGKATCQIYRIVEDSLRIPQLMAVSGLTKTVYNFSTSVISRDWISIQRTKFGHWIPIVGRGGDDGTLIVRFKITDASFCAVCTATVTIVSRPYGVLTVPEEVNSTIVVIDKLGCMLNEPTDDLTNRYGYAAYMTNYDEPFPAGCPGQPESAWEMIQLCCLEDAC